MSRRSLLIRFFVLALPLLLVLAVLHVVDREMERERWRRQMASVVEQAISGLTGDFHEAAADALALAADGEFRRRLLANDVTSLSSRFEALARYKPHYRQIRYLDASGLERLRVDTDGNGKVLRVAHTDLQDKADRDYFREAINLPDGTVRLSRLDLNIEHGRIETPHNPMLRFSSPVFDAAGNRRGVVVINLGVAPLLARLGNAGSTLAGESMLVNSRGSWLAGGDPVLRWGDILGNSNGFAQSHPEAWQRLGRESDSEPTQWQADDHLIARATLHPVDIVRSRLARSTIGVESADPWWAVIGAVDLATVDAGPQVRLKTGLTIAAAALLLWLFILHGWRRLNLAAHAASQHIQKLARVVEQTSDVVFITDPDGRIEYVNPAFSTTTGYAGAEAEGQTPAILKSGQHALSFYETLWQDIRQGKQFRDLFINRRRDGTLFYEEKTISPLTDEQGRIISYVSTGKDITDSKVTRLAFYDQLTGLVNRTLFMDRLENEMAHAARSGKHLGILYMDLDGFKAINDSLGHQAGDTLLREFAARIGALRRKSDTLARLGGDEFAMLLRDIDSVADAEQVAAKIVVAMQEEWQADGQPVALGVSIGIVLYPLVDLDGASLLTRADAAMYDAKRGGRNRFVVHTEAQQPTFPGPAEDIPMS